MAKRPLVVALRAASLGRGNPSPGGTLSGRSASGCGAGPEQGRARMGEPLLWRSTPWPLRFAQHRRDGATPGLARRIPVVGFRASGRSWGAPELTNQHPAVALREVGLGPENREPGGTFPSRCSSLSRAGMEEPLTWRSALQPSRATRRGCDGETAGLATRLPPVALRAARLGWVNPWRGGAPSSRRASRARTGIGEPATRRIVLRLLRPAQ